MSAFVDGLRRRWDDAAFRKRLGIAAAAGIVIAVVIVCIQAVHNADDTDFTRYWYGGRNLVTGNAIYGPAAPDLGFKYHPLFAIWMAPFGSLPVSVAGFFWYAINVAYIAGAFWMAYRVVFPRGGASWWAILVVAAVSNLLVHNLKTGQVNVTNFFFEILGAYWICRYDGKRDGLAGVAIGLAATIKYTPLALVPYLALRRRWKAVGGAFVGLAIFGFIVPSIVLGPVRHWELTRQWLSRGSQMFSNYEAGVGYSPGISTTAFLRHLLQARTATSERYGDLFVNVTDWPSADVSRAILVLNVAIVALLLFGLFSRTRRDDPLRLPLEIAAVILTVHLVSPETRKAHLISLIWVYMVAGGFILRPRGVEPSRRSWTIAGLAAFGLIALTKEPLFAERTLLALSALCDAGFGALFLLLAAILTLRLRPFAEAGVERTARSPVSPLDFGGGLGAGGG
ncbi:MAG: DUF2029 domain-containing protein [Planctomycetes bacterium]|nr:DUF2029 domain-containing protein [Planctomycetota bacterium]